METENNCGVKRPLQHHEQWIWSNGTAHPSSSLLCGRLLLVFWAQHCFCSSSLHRSQVYSLCWCGRPGKWKSDTSCQAKGPSSLSLHANVDRKEKKKLLWVFTMTQSARLNNCPGEASEHQWAGSTTSGRMCCLTLLASAVCSSVHLTLNTTAASFSHRGQKLPPRCFPHLLMDMINKCSGFHRQLDGPRERSKVCFRGELQRQWTSSPWLFHDVMWRDWAQPRRSAFIPEKSWTQTREGRHANLNMAKSLDLSGACASTPPAHLQLSLTQPLLIVKHVTWSTRSYWLFSASQSLSATVCFILVSGSLKMLPEKIHKVCVLPPRLCTREHSTTDTSTSALTFIVLMAVYSEQLRCDVEPAPRLVWADLNSAGFSQCAPGLP